MDHGQDRFGGGSVDGGPSNSELVGCYAFSADKVGRDVGTLCGIEPLDIVATNDVDQLIALRPDCVSYMPFRPDIDHVVRILEAGINVVTTMYKLAGDGYGPKATQRNASQQLPQREARRCTRRASTRVTHRWWRSRPARCAHESTG